MAGVLQPGKLKQVEAWGDHSLLRASRSASGRGLPARTPMGTTWGAGRGATGAQEHSPGASSLWRRLYLAQAGAERPLQLQLQLGLSAPHASGTPYPGASSSDRRGARLLFVPPGGCTAISSARSPGTQLPSGWAWSEPFRAVAGQSGGGCRSRSLPRPSGPSVEDSLWPDTPPQGAHRCPYGLAPPLRPPMPPHGGARVAALLPVLITA